MPEMEQLGAALIEAGIITVKTFENALKRQQASGKPLDEIIVAMGVITEEELVDLLVKRTGLKPVANFAAHSFPPEIISLIPAETASGNRLFPLKAQDGKLAVAVIDPFDHAALDTLARTSGMKIIPFLATRQELVAAIRKHYPEEQSLSGGKQKVLVVDDSMTIAAMVRGILVEEGYDVIVAGDGFEGEAMARAERPDMIICDEIMPKMDGFGMLAALRKHPETAEIPVILLTSKASVEDEQRALDSGFIDFIPKPVQKLRVVSRVKRAFEISHNLKK
jgi:PleD family two-component response regulator